MKKLTKKLTLNKQTMAALDKSEMQHVKGGFTYSLSTGDSCKMSQEKGDTYKETCQYLCSTNAQ
jgi:natural product precursor